jgi:hypothetical protein
MNECECEIWFLLMREKENMKMLVKKLKIYILPETH